MIGLQLLLSRENRLVQGQHGSKTKEYSSSMYWQYTGNLLSESWYESDDHMTRQAASDSRTAGCTLASGTLPLIHITSPTDIEELLGGSLQSKSPEYAAPQLCLELPASLVSSPSLSPPILEHVAAFFLRCWFPGPLGCLSPPEHQLWGPSPGLTLEAQFPVVFL